MGEWRSEWQAFKKKYPDFEDSKKFKSDVGPQMDDYEKACKDLVKQVESLKKSFDDTLKTGKSLLAAIKGYSTIVDDLDKTNKGIDREFMGVMTTGNNISFSPKNDLETKLGNPQQYWVNFQ